MRPADETPAFGFSEPQNCKSNRLNCQHHPAPVLGRPQDECGVAISDRHPVIILDSSAEHATTFVEALKEATIEATAFQSKDDFLGLIARRPIELAVLVLHSKSRWRGELRQCCDSIRYLQKMPEVICVLQWPPEGPMDRIFGETLGVAVLHEW